MADAADLKSAGRETVWVRLPPALPKMARHLTGRFCFSPDQVKKEGTQRITEKARRYTEISQMNGLFSANLCLSSP